MGGTAEYDLIIRNGMLVDGTGLPRRRVDVGIRDGKVARIARLDGVRAAEEIDAAGMIVAPGIVDPHTHYDPQITVDPYATMSCYHGVTTVLAGNCGFSVAPVRKAQCQALADIFARVEDMDAAALSAIPWGDAFETFGEFVASRQGGLGVNFACYVGHSNLRLWVMGEDAFARAATEPEILAMQKLLQEAMAAGAAGISSSSAPTHLDIHDRPVPSRLAETDELLALAAELGRFGAGSICYLPQSAIGGLNEADQQLLIDIGRQSGLPVIIQGIGGRNKVDAPTATWDASVRFLDEATAQGAPIYSLLIVRPFDRTVRISEDNFHYAAVPDWLRMLRASPEDRRALLRDPAERDKLRHAVDRYNRDPAQGSTLPPPMWSVLSVTRTALAENRWMEGQSLVQLAEDAGKTPADFMLDLALEEDFGTVFRWLNETPEWSDAVRIAQHDPRMIVGVSDGGAHLAKDDGADWSSYFLRRWVLDAKVWSLEEGVRQITQVPAALLGFSERGTIRVGAWADIMIFDPETIGPWRKEFVRDLPGGAGRYKAWGKGMKATIVNGQPIVLDGELTGRLPGQFIAPN